MKQVLQMTLLTVVSVSMGWSQVTKSDFDNLTLSPNSYADGSNGSGNFSSGDAIFQNKYHQATSPSDYSYWTDGFAYSNQVNANISPDYTNQYSAVTGKDYSGNGNYALGKDGAKIYLTGAAVNTTVTGFYLTNSTYAALSMEQGDGFAKKFGGTSGNDPDYFKLTITGYTGGAATSTTVVMDLADFTNSDNSFDYVLKNWRWVDLRPLGNIDSLSFALSSTDNGLYGMNTPGYFVIDEFNAPLFSTLGGQPGSTAIAYNNSSIVNWATACTVTRGPQDISSPASPLASYGRDTNAIGPATGTTLVSLGDGGNGVLTFAHPITNGTGADFAVFENGFTSGSLLFAELAFVEVSSDGTNFFRFPAVSNTNPTVQNNSTYSDPQLLYNLAGSAQVNYGTPFDLSELAGKTGLDVNAITHVKVIDVVGSINPAYATYDKNGNAVNDPWKTPYASCGFDLDAVAVLHENAITGVIAGTKKASILSLYPNPTTDLLQVSFKNNIEEGVLLVLDIHGAVLLSEAFNANADQVSVNVSELKQGMYILQCNGEAQSFIKQ
jgi:hypothetical protein